MGLVAASATRTSSRSREIETTCRIPVKLDPGFDLSDTSDLGRMVQQWGTVPLSMLSHLASQNYTYAFVGHEDFTMYPILQPGSFVQVDESRTTRGGAAVAFRIRAADLLCRNARRIHLLLVLIPAELPGLAAPSVVRRRRCEFLSTRRRRR